MNVLEKLQAAEVGDIKTEVNLAEYTTYQINGKAKALVVPQTIEQLQNLLAILVADDVKHMVIGRGSNIVFTQSFYDGVLISLAQFQNLSIDGYRVRVGSGYNLIKLAYSLARKGLSGLEFAAGIPGTVGGAVYMNAGAYGAEFSDLVEQITVLTPDLTIKEMSNEELEFSYRTSWLQNNEGYICLEAVLKLQAGDANESLLLIEDRKRRRLQSQPLEYPSAGSVFRNPPNDYAGRLVEELGFKGYQIGAAKVSCKHANFIINTADASGADIKKLIEEIRTEVAKKYQIDLIVEQEFID